MKVLLIFLKKHESLILRQVRLKPKQNITSSPIQKRGEGVDTSFHKIVAHYFLVLVQDYFTESFRNFTMNSS